MLSWPTKCAGGSRACKTYESFILTTGEFEIHQEGLRV
jgi:hypothetical protein